jgi:hypothetical protein
LPRRRPSNCRTIGGCVGTSGEALTKAEMHKTFDDIVRDKLQSSDAHCGRLPSSLEP